MSVACLRNIVATICFTFKKKTAADQSTHMKRIYASLLRSSTLVPDQATRSLVSRIMATSTYALGTYVALGTLGFDTSPIMAAMGVTGATVGFACKDIGANMAAGLSLAAQRPFQYGSHITIGKDYTGVVDHWDMRYLYLRGNNNTLLHVPNAIVFTQVIVVHDPPQELFERDERGSLLPGHGVASAAQTMAAAATWTVVLFGVVKLLAQVAVVFASIAFLQAMGFRTIQDFSTVLAPYNPIGLLTDREPKSAAPSEARP